MKYLDEKQERIKSRYIIPKSHQFFYHSSFPSAKQLECQRELTFSKYLQGRLSAI